jgi:hypothetical protein
LDRVRPVVVNRNLGESLETTLGAPIFLHLFGRCCLGRRSHG